MADPHPYVGLWVTDDGDIRHELLPDGRYDEARGTRESAYRGRYEVTGNHIDYIDDTGFTADGDFIDGVLHHAGMVLRRSGSTAVNPVRGLRAFGTLAVAAVALTLSSIAPVANAQAQATSSATTATERANKETVRRAYAEWAAGGTRFFDILDERVVWTILGTGPHAQTYRSKAAFLAGAVEPFGVRVSVPLRPTVRSIHADGNDVVILWDGVATTRDDRTYRNTYAWFFTMRDGRVVEAKALLDLQAYGDVLARVPAAPRP